MRKKSPFWIIIKPSLDKKGEAEIKGVADMEVMAEIHNKIMDQKMLKATSNINHNRNKTDDLIYADSRVTSHIINNPGKLKLIVPYKGYDKIFAGNGQGLQTSHIGNAALKNDY